MIELGDLAHRLISGEGERMLPLSDPADDLDYPYTGNGVYPTTRPARNG